MPVPLLTPGDTYRTPEDTPRHSWLARFCPGVSALFYASVYHSINTGCKLVQAGQYNDNDQIWYERSIEIFRGMEKVGGRIEITGLDILKGLTGPVVYVGNHMSSLETVILPCIFLGYGRLCFVMKEELTTMPLFGPVVSANKPITVGRANGKADLEKVLREGAQRLQDGRSVCIFPQGTRSAAFDPKKFNSLGSKLAHRAGVPIVPFAVKTDFWSQGWPIKDLGWIRPERPVKVAFGPLIPAGTDSKQSHAACVAFVQERLAAWGAGRS